MLSGSYLPEVKWDHVITDEDWFHVSCLNLMESPSTNKLFYNNYLDKIELIEYSYKAIITHYQKWQPSCVYCIRILSVDFCLFYSKKCCKCSYYMFDIIIIILAINCCIEFITVMNYVKAIISDIMSQGMK